MTTVPEALEEQWFAAAARVEIAERGGNPDAYAAEFGQKQLARTAREGILGMLHLFPDDVHWTRVHMDEWDVDSLAGDGWVEYPVPGPGRAFVKEDTAALIVHKLSSYEAEEVPAKNMPKSNTTDGQHVIIRRIGKKSAPLVAKMLAAAATTLEGK